ncbi:type IV secretion system DNA-binding domain-containing protein [Candidatus Woesebacteria bacterium]|nr:type IV secretion system DNA-binding domain-containing protein [Candidatus Woesebacteria bacterium]MCD8527208.1 type IV secretion system DNA-binding domain-containing protein [Candidatus Woesebacteria bacterium]
MAGFFLIFYLILQWFKYRGREQNSLEMVMMQVLLPKDNEVKIEAAEQLFNALHSIADESWFKGLFSPPPHLSFEIIGVKESITFNVLCPAELCDLVQKQIHATYPGVKIKPIDEPNIFSEGGKTAYAALKLDSGTNYPIKTFKDLPSDPLNLLTSAFSKIQEGEGVMLQFLIEPAKDKWRDKAQRFVEKTKESETNSEGKKVRTVDHKALDAVTTKTEKLGFRVALRVVVSAPDEYRAKSHLNNIVSTFSQFTSQHNSFKKTKVWFKQAFMMDFLYRYFPLFGQGTFILNTEELATVLHFPNKTVETHHIEWLNAKSAPASNLIPNEGLYLGKAVYMGAERKIFMGLNDRRRHMYIIGKTGTGKSEFLKEMILQDIEAGYGVCAIDPHGEFVEDILQLMPPERAEDVVYFNPSDIEYPMGLNIMEAETEDQKHFMAQSVISLMYKLYDPNRTGIIGPRFEHAVRNAMLTIMSVPGTSFIELVRALTDQSYVEEILPMVEDPVVRRYWTDQMAQTSDFHKSEVLDYIVSKFGRFVTNKTMRNIIGQSKSAFDLRKIMDEQKILLVNLSKGRLGEEDAKFLGLILVPKILTAAMSRQDMDPKLRKDFFLYVDEFQNYATEDFAVILSEARKYRLNLIVANQFISQIQEDVKNAVFGNVGTMVSFRVGVPDANFLQNEFTPTFNETDLTNIEKYHVYVKSIVNNEPIPPFSMSLYKDMSVQEARMNEKLAETLRELSRLKYGKPRHLVEEEIGRRAKL